MRSGRRSIASHRHASNSGLWAPPAGRATSISLSGPDEAERKPFLHLATIPARPAPAGDVLGDIVGIPFRSFGQQREAADVGFLVDLPNGGVVGILAFVDASLRHLPFVRVGRGLRSLRATADEDGAGGIDQHGADAGPVGQVLPPIAFGRHVSVSRVPSRGPGGHRAFPARSPIPRRARRSAGGRWRRPARCHARVQHARGGRERRRWPAASGSGR